MAAHIKVAEAKIQTVQVAIQALKVGPKQVTMGMFRQLQFAALVDPRTVQLHGVPWGHVNYWWDGDGRSPVLHDNELHVVWQDGDSLRRGIVYEEPPRDMVARFDLRLGDLLAALFLVTLPSATELTWGRTLYSDTW